MITILFLLSVIGIIIYNIRDESSCYSGGWKGFLNADWGLVGLCSLAMSLLSFGVCLGVGLGVFAFTNSNIEVSRVKNICNIYSIRNSDRVSGQFCLGSGYIQSTEYYYMFSKNNQGGYERCQLKANDCIIYQNEANQPNIAWQTITYRPSYWIHIWPGKMNRTVDTKYDIHVPTNTIIEEFQVK